MSTITLSNIPDLTAAVSVPRLTAIEYPLGRPFGQPGDAAGQRAILRATLQALEEMDTPGSVRHLPFEWSEPADEADAHREPPPIAKHLRRRPWLYPRLLSRNVPE